MCVYLSIVSVYSSTNMMYFPIDKYIILMYNDIEEYKMPGRSPGGKDE